MVSKTLMLTGGMPEANVLDDLRQACHDKALKSLNLVSYDFGDSNKSCEIVVSSLIDLIQSERSWNTIRITQCTGERVQQIVEAALASTTRRLILSPTRDTTRAYLSPLSKVQPSQNSLLTLGLHDVKFDEQIMDEVCDGLARNEGIMELSFGRSRFSQDDSCHLCLAKSLRKMACLQHLSFQDCRLTDSQASDLIHALDGKQSLLELSLDGNKCHSRAMAALSKILPHSNLLLLDISCQKTRKTLDLMEFAIGLRESSVRCLQLSENDIKQPSLEALSNAIATSKSISVLHLAWVKLDSEGLAALSHSLSLNSSLSKLVLYECGIGNAGLGQLGKHLPNMKNLRKLDIGGVQDFDSEGLSTFLQGLERNTQIEEISLRPCPEVEVATFLCDVNRGGRRFLQEETSPSALWPRIFSRVSSLRFPSMVDSFADPSKGYQECPVADEPTRKVSVLYHLLRNNGPLLQQTN